MVESEQNGTREGLRNRFSKPFPDERWSADTRRRRRAQASRRDEMVAES